MSRATDATLGDEYVPLGEVQGFLPKPDPGALPDTSIVVDPEAEMLNEDLQIPREPEADYGNAVVTRLSEVEPKQVDWLWPLKIPRGKLTLFQGDPGLGKSFVSLDVAARVSTGREWPDCPGVPNPAGDVILLQAEDGLEDTVAPRVQRLGGDPNRIFVLRGTKGSSAGRVQHFSLKDDLGALIQVLEATPDARLLIIDPITAYLGDANAFKNTEVRGLLAPVMALAEDWGIAVLALTHLNKNIGTNAIYRGMDSLAFVAAARAAWLFAEDRKTSGRRLIVPLKGNVIPDPQGIAYRLIEGQVQWDADPVLVTADQALATPPAGARPTRRDEAREFLKNALGDGPVSTNELLQRAEVAGISERTLNRAKTELGIESAKDGMKGGWTWMLPDCNNAAQKEGSQEPPEIAIQSERQPSDNLAALGVADPLDAGRGNEAA